ncbi:hypothetical protein EI982_09390 [Haloplanus rallus]|jgi:hypothetical protein|uniref:DUF8173 domain-containing protein n=1 Tax=Haloplanus rallus TaxID=1816183 RepID=A0A6B9F3V9_9EURY|nr:hypothetical protein [Haloplanus rallus]QGX94988.1 hypothetical protein EI982_09390 [Haloplanus rallus]
MPSTRSLARVGSAAVPVVAALSLAGLAAAQSPVADADIGARLAARFVGGFLVNLVLAGLLVLLAPSYARRTVGAIRDDPGSAFLWGLLVGIALPIGLVLLALTIIGLLITIPGLIGVAILGVVGNAVAVCWIGGLLTGGDVDGAAVGAGALVFAVVAVIPLVGNLATTLLGFFGLGVVGRDLYTSWQG